MATMKRLPAWVTAMSIGFLAAGAATADEVDYLALDEASKRAINSACASWVYRDAAQWIAPWVEAVAPLCAAQAAATPGTTAPSPPSGDAGTSGQ